jgi:hypothetical protein
MHCVDSALTESTALIPVNILDLRGSVGGTDVSGQHLEGSGLSGSIHTEQAKALRTMHQEKDTDELTLSGRRFEWVLDADLL